MQGILSGFSVWHAKNTTFLLHSTKINSITAAEKGLYPAFACYKFDLFLL